MGQKLGQEDASQRGAEEKLLATEACGHLLQAGSRSWRPAPPPASLASAGMGV